MVNADEKFAVATSKAAPSVSASCVVSWMVFASTAPMSIDGPSSRKTKVLPTLTVALDRSPSESVTVTVNVICVAISDSVSSGLAASAWRIARI